MRWLARPAGTEAPHLLAWRLVHVPGDFAERREIHGDRWFVQGVALDISSRLPRGWEAEGDIEIGGGEQLDGDPPATARRDLVELLGAEPAVPVRMPGKGRPRGVLVVPGDEELVLGARVAPGAIEQQWSKMRDRFLLQLAGLAALVAGGFVLLVRMLRRERALVRRKEDFVAAVTHELKTPLTGIRMYAEMLKEGWVSSPEAADRYASRILGESERLGHLVDQVLDLAALERGVEMLKDVQPEPPAAQPLAEAPQPVRGAIALQDVSVRYRDGAAFALDRVTLDIPAGETVALVGPSGAGKTTLVNLLPRFVRPDSGTVRIDGADTAHWPLIALRRQMAMVSQDVVMLNASVAANVALGAPAVDRARVEQCLADANLAEHVATLPQGIDTLLGHNATQLSGGQRQRLAIARALYKNAPILLLDEATSALDTESERLVQQAIGRVMKGRTTLVIAHRLSTIEHADRIVVMERGRIVEQGTHGDLLRAGGVYARLQGTGALLDEAG